MIIILLVVIGIIYILYLNMNKIPKDVLKLLKKISNKTKTDALNNLNEMSKKDIRTISAYMVSAGYIRKNINVPSALLDSIIKKKVLQNAGLKKIKKDTPDTSGTPDTPDTPDTPGTPDTPDTPDTPGTPDTPDTPGTPDTPDTPDTPGTPDTPDTSGTPDTPDTPGMEEETYSYEITSPCRVESQPNFVDDTDVKYGTITHKKGGDMYTSVRVSKGGVLQGVQKFKCGEWYKGIDIDPTRDGYNWVVCDPRFFNKPYPSWSATEIDGVPYGKYCEQNFDNNDVKLELDLTDNPWYDSSTSIPTNNTDEPNLDDCRITLFAGDEGSAQDEADTGEIWTILESKTPNIERLGNFNDEQLSLQPYMGCGGVDIESFQHTNYGGSSSIESFKDRTNSGMWVELGDKTNTSSLKILRV